MLDHRCTAAQTELSREQLFAERYQALLAFAMHLTRQQRDSAEDLVQDAFVQFTLARTQLEEIENINAYLRRLMRNMYISKVTRSAQRLHDTTLSIADYDTLRAGWTTIEPSRRMQAAEQLHQICTYACFRKQSSRAGSVLILRYFLDYLPTEIAGVISSSRHCVDQWQRLARREVKLFLEEPNRLRFVDAKTVRARAWTRYPASDCDLMFALRGIIFDSRQGPCLSKDELAEIYAGAKAESLSTTELAHIVSCPKCLDIVNALLGLPLLAERYAAQDCGRNEPPPDDDGGGGSGTPLSPLPLRLQRQVHEIREHKPSELRIVVNGALLSSLRVSSDLSEFDLSLLAEEPVEFIEVLSEQDKQLLFLSINGAARKAEQWAEIDLSEGRTLEVCLRLDDGPRLHVVYADPGANEVGVEKSLSSPLTVAPLVQRKRLVEFLRGRFKRAAAAEESGSSSKAGTTLSLLGQSPDFAGSRLRYSPVWLTVLLVTVIAGALLVYRVSVESPPTAATLLAQALIAETDHARTAARVAHRTMNLEIRGSSEGAVVSRQSVESWENYDRHERIQRLYDDNGHLIAAALQDAKGARRVYRQHANLSESSAGTFDSLLLELEDVWQLTPTVQEFNSLIAEPAAAAVQQGATSYILTFERERAIGASRLLKAQLTLSKTDLRPIEQTLVVQRGEEWREYKFVEKSFELVPAKDVAPAIFEIEPELLGKADAVRAGEVGLRTTSAGLPSPTSTTAVASTELEIDVAYLLNQAKGGRNEQVALTRSTSGSLRVEGVVDSAERRAEFLRVLRPVSGNPAVSIQIRTVAEAAQSTATRGGQSFREVEATASSIAVAGELREYFARRGTTDGDVDQTVRAYSSQVVNHGYRALFHAVELKRLLDRFARVDLRTLAPDARGKWFQMLRDHASACEDETLVLRRELQPIFFSDTQFKRPEDSIHSDAELARAVESLHRMTLANNEAIRQAFTISAQSSPAGVKSAQFARNLEQAAVLAKQIAQYSQ